MRKTSNLVTHRSYRFSPMLAFQVNKMARQYDLTESEFVRKVLMELIDRQDY